MRALYKLIAFTTCIIPSLCGEHPDGESTVSRTQDALGNYHFRYSVANGEGEQFREEGTDPLGRVIGSYGLTHVDGTHRVVDYVADKDGFRAAVRSNEPGVASAEAADAPIIRSDHNAPLYVAATSDEQSREVFGKRLDNVGSRVAYVSEEEEEKTNKENDESVRESRQRNFNDYRPLNPVAYYPTDSRSPLSPPAVRPIEQARSPRVLSQDAEEDSKPLDVYFPPINPHTAVRRPPYYLPRDRSTDTNFFPTTTSQKPFIPPYGGFDDDPLPPVDKRPGVSIHRGIGLDYPISTPSPISAHGGRRFPPIVSPEDRDFNLPRFPPSSGYPPNPPRGALPPFSQDIPPPLFDPPSYDGRIGVPNFVLRAVPIPNGIQAVRVDPTSGRVYERLVYPVFLGHDGNPEYDRNILLHNDDVSDDDTVRHEDPGYLDMPYLRRPFRDARSQPSGSDEGPRIRNGRYNGSYGFDEKSLSEPSAADISWIKKQLDLVEGFNREHFSDGLLSNRFPHRDSGFSRGDQFDENRQQYERRIQSSRVPVSSDLLSYLSKDNLSRGTRSHTELSPDSSETISSKLQRENESSRKAESESEVSEIKQ